MSSNCYSLNDIQKLLFNDIKYVLPNNVIDIIKQLENELKIQDNQISSSSPSFSINENKKKYKHPTIEMNWERKSSEKIHPPIIFKSTKIEAKEGIDKHTNDIRIYLNKLTDKNYETQTKLIVDKINIIMNEPNTSCDWKESIFKIFFTIIVSNKFFSELYSKLFKELIEINNFEFIHDFIHKEAVQFKFTIDNIEYMDPNTDYNEYCKFTKINDSRKALCLFFINLVKMKVLKINTIYDILQYFLEKSLVLIEIPDKSNEVEEITENIYIIVTNMYPYIQSTINNEDHSNWTKLLLPQIISLSQMKLKDHPSLSNRVIFKYMDIIDMTE